MRYTIYIYVDGSNLQEIHKEFRSKITQFIESEDIVLVDDLYPRDDTMNEDDLPDWNLGVNFDPQQFTDEKLELILAFFHGLAGTSGREFSVGYYDHKNGINQDFGTIEKEAIYDTELKILKEIKEANKSAHTIP